MLTAAAADTAVLKNCSVLPAVLISLYLHRCVNEALCVSRKARLQRGNLLLKQGKLDEAESDFKKVVSSVVCIVEAFKGSPGVVRLVLW